MPKLVIVINILLPKPDDPRTCQSPRIRNTHCRFLTNVPAHWLAFHHILLPPEKCSCGWVSRNEDELVELIKAIKLVDESRFPAVAVSNAPRILNELFLKFCTLDNPNPRQTFLSGPPN
jgi:hypothetical protein